MTKNHIHRCFLVIQHNLQNIPRSIKGLEMITKIILGKMNQIITRWNSRIMKMVQGSMPFEFKPTPWIVILMFSFLFMTNPMFE